MKKTLISDFDGTLINCTLEIELIKFLVRTKKLKIYHYILAPFVIFINFFPLYFLKKGEWLKTWTLFLSNEQQNKIFEQFFFDFKNKQLINQNVIEIIRNFKGNKILLTGCYEPLAVFFLKKLKIDYMFDDIIGSRVGAFNFFVDQHPFGKDKVKFLSNYICSIGLGDSFIDNYFLKHCEKIYVVGDNQKLISYAIKNGWNYEVIKS
tara:strand:+ start:1559 stop:2179 length:621 start_codon:yes stop_codon:yes gene_type:complete